MNSVSLTNLNFELQGLIADSANLQTGGITQAKVTRCALYALGTLNAALTIPLTVTLFPLAIVTAGVAYFCFSKAFGIHDYQNPKELNRMRIDAFKQSFETIVSSHGIQNIIAYNIASKDLLAQKFLQYCITKPFSDVVNFKFTDLIQLGAISPQVARAGFFSNCIQRDLTELNRAHLNVLKEMSVLSLSDYSFMVRIDDLVKQYCKEYNSALLELDAAFPGRTDRLLKELDEKSIQVKQTALDLKNQILSKGYNTFSNQADVKALLDSVFTNKPRGEVLSKNIDCKIDAFLNLDEVAKKVSQDYLKTELGKIQAQKEYIQQNNLGQDQQNLYDFKKISLNQSFKDRLNDLEDQICRYCQ